MFSPRSVMALLVMVALSAKAAESAIAAPDLCSAADVGVGFCLTCKTKAQCFTAGLPSEPRGDCTVPGEACTVLAGVATCKPIAETVCSCDSAAQCDAYDPDSVLICLSGDATISQNCSVTEGETCVGGVCTEVTTTPSPDDVCVGAPDGFTVITPLCTTAAYCGGGISQGISNCPSGNYFDMDEMRCMPIPPVPCAGCGTGACPDKSDCSKWYICDGGMVLDEETCDAATPEFDIVSNECVASGSGICTGNDNCTYGITTSATTVTTTVVSSSDGSSTDDGGTTDNGGTTGDGGTTSDGGTTVNGSTTGTTGDGGTTGGGSDSTTSAPGSTDDSTTTTSRPTECTADNVGQRYPFEGNCKKYWACLQVGTGQYAYVESTCLGELVFNPNTGDCDTLTNVPGCVVPAAVFF